MMSAQLLLNKWRPDTGRVDKIRRLAQYWIDDFAEPRSDGTLTWHYIRHSEMTQTEDVGHASVDLDFLIAAHQSGLTRLTRSHMDGLVRTYLRHVVDGRGSLNNFVDGTSEPGFDEHWNAAVGWFGLARFDPAVVDAALAVYNVKYRSDSEPGILWARPMLGWANLLCAARRC